MGHLPCSLGPLSMMVGVVTLLRNEVAAMGANYFVWKNIWRIFYVEKDAPCENALPKFARKNLTTLKEIGKSAFENAIA